MKKQDFEPDYNSIREKSLKLTEEMADFIYMSPTAFNAVFEIANRLLKLGFKQLHEGDQWNLEKGSGYFVTRNNSSIIAFKIPEKERATLKDSKESPLGFMIAASHGDSPTFRIKEDPEILSKEGFTILNTEGYGGMIMSSWLDRPLSLAGRVIIKKSNDEISTEVIRIDQDLTIIPSLAIHLNREVNNGYHYNPKKDMLPIISLKDDFSLDDIISKELGVSPDQILGSDLYLYNRQKPSFIGAEKELIASFGLDDKQNAYANFIGFSESKAENSIPIYAMLDNEEVGSSTKQGANSTFLSDVIRRINLALGGNDETLVRRISGSFMISCDNGHSVHPNHPDKSDLKNRPMINKGIVIKHSANQSYTTDGVSQSILKLLCKNAKIPYQHYSNRSDLRGGSTLGNIVTGSVSINSVDIGLAQLAMHSSYELAGVYDTYYMAMLSKTFFNSWISTDADGNYKFFSN